MTTENEPGWVEENQLADRLGWVCLKDKNRSVDPADHWCLFKKGFERVWMCIYDRVWKRARYLAGMYIYPKNYTTLEQALKGETNDK